MLEWVAAIGGIAGAVLFDVGTSIGSGLVGNIYGEYKVRKFYEKKMKQFRAQLKRKFDEFNKQPNEPQQEQIEYFSKMQDKNSDDIKVVVQKKDLDRLKSDIFDIVNDLFLTSRQMSAINDAKNIINEIKECIKSGRELTIEQLRRLYNIFAKKNWLIGKFSPNIIRKDDELIKIIMEEINRPLELQNKNYNNKSIDQNDEIDEKDKKVDSLLDIILKFNIVLNDEVKKYKVFFDFLAQYSGCKQESDDDGYIKWGERDCELIDDFIKDKEFEMYDDVEELYDCCKRIEDIRKIISHNTLNKDSEKVNNKLTKMLKDKYTLLGKQLDDIQKKDKRFKNNKNAVRYANYFKTNIENQNQDILNIVNTLIETLKNNNYADNSLIDINNNTRVMLK